MIDLRQTTPKPATTTKTLVAAPSSAQPTAAAPVVATVTVPPAAPAPTPMPVVAPEPAQVATAPVEAPQLNSAPVAKTEPTITTEAQQATATAGNLGAVTSIVPNRKQARLANVQAVVKSVAIKKFQPGVPTPVPEPVAVAPAPQPATMAPAATPVATVPQTAVTPTTVAPPTAPSVPVIAAPVVPLPPADTEIKATPAPAPVVVAPFKPATPAAPAVVAAAPTPKPALPAVAAVPKPTAPAPISAVMPPAVTTAIDANKRLLTPQDLAKADPATARKQAFALALANAPRRNTLTSAAAAAAVVVIMGGYVWLQNVPKLAVHTASAKAGFTASLPTYMPSNYTMNRTVSSSPGRVSLAFSAPGNNGLTINQTQTNWDPQSLLDNYVSKQSNQYLAVNGQGLTIYLYNGDEASWVNQGIWYSIQGNNQLNREQLLKIAYGL